MKVWASPGNIDFGHIAQQMTDEIRENVGQFKQHVWICYSHLIELYQLVDETLADWILPDFTSTTPVDQAVCSILMMASLNA